MFDPQELAKTLGNLQEKLKEAQEESKNLTFSAKSGGGLVHITANGGNVPYQCPIAQTWLEDKESLQILLMSAFNDISKSVEQNRKNMAMGMLGNLGEFPFKGL